MSMETVFLVVCGLAIAALAVALPLYVRTPNDDDEATPAHRHEAR